MSYKKKLIEVALPLEAINKASAREKSIRHGHPSTLHLWWARRPLAAARAVIFAQMVDDPSEHPDLFPTEKAQAKERKRLFDIIEELVQWENTNNEEVLQKAREAIWQSWRRTCAENADHPRAAELFDRHKLPGFHDPFAGGGSLPLEAQRLGLEAYASDLNPVAVLINKAMIEIPPKFAGQPPVNPKCRSEKGLFEKQWRGAEGLAEDVRYYGQWMRDEAQRRIGHLYPKVEITKEMVAERPDLAKYEGQKLTVIAWLWARTIKSPNPAFAHCDVPLISSFVLSSKAGREAYVFPIIDGDRYRFEVRVGKPENDDAAKNGTKVGRGGFRCLLSQTPISSAEIRTAGRAGHIGNKLMAMVLEVPRGRIFISPTQEQEAAAQAAEPTWQPTTSFSPDALGFRIGAYGLQTWGDLFTRRQLCSLDTFSTLLSDVTGRIRADAQRDEELKDSLSLDAGGQGAAAYADAVAVYLALGISKLADSGNSLVSWKSSMEQPIHLFTRQAIPMVWDFAEPNVFSGAMGDLQVTLGTISRALSPLGGGKGHVLHRDARQEAVTARKVVSTDPPYYDNIGYADLSDFFYVWLRRGLRSIFPSLFATIETPKDEELVACPARRGSRKDAETYFLDGMTEVMERLGKDPHPAFPVTIYYAFKQAEKMGEEVASTGWETFLDALAKANLVVNGTWPVRTELSNRIRGSESNALATSIVLVCRQREHGATTITRRDFLKVLREELPTALAHLQHSNIAPVDLAQAAIGPGMAVYTRYSKVLDAEGNPLSVREALALINEILDQTLAEQEGDFDADSRWALAWFEQSGFADGDFGVAETLSKAKNTSIRGLEESGILVAKAGKVRLLKPEELPERWDPSTDSRLSVWEMVHHLIRVLEGSGESAAADLVKKLGTKAEIARELCYRLYTICERKKRANEARSYNNLVQSWPEITRLAREAQAEPQQGDLFEEVSAEKVG